MINTVIVSPADLRFVVITCRTCNTRVTLDMGRKYENPAQPSGFAPARCPSCDQHYDSSLPDAINAAREAYRALTKAQVAKLVVFHAGTTPE